MLSACSVLGACFVVAKCHKRPRLITSFYGIIALLLNPIRISAALYAVDRLDTYITTESKISASLHPPAFSIGFSDLLGEHHKDEEDEESLEGHHDGVDVGQSDQLLHFYYQHSQYPC